MRNSNFYVFLRVRMSRMSRILAEDICGVYVSFAGLTSWRILLIADKIII